MERGESAMPTRITDRYDILSCLKHSDKRKVYLIRDKQKGEKAVLKCGSGSNGDLLFQEYNITKTFSSKCDILLNSIDYFFEEHTHYYIHEYASGCTLAQIVAENGALPEEESRRIVAALCEGISILHSQKPPIICRDINPDNVLICEDGRIKLVDMDSARYYDKTASTDTYCIGTKEMAAPEQFGYVQTNERTDIYVLGMLLLFLSTGTYDRHSKLSASLKKIVLKSTAFDPEGRYKSVMQMRKALIEQRKKNALIAAVIAVAILLLCVAVFMLSRIPSADDIIATSEASDALEVSETLAEFVSPNIERAVRLQLGKTESEPLYTSELEGVDTLLLCGDLAFTTWEELTNYHQLCIDSYAALPRATEPLILDDLELLTGLKYLCLDKQGITEIPQLPEGLERLSIMDNELTSVDGIERCKHLQELHLSGNFSLIDISALSALSELKILNLACCVSLTSIEAVTSLPLELLHINYTDVKHVETLSQLTQLKELLFSDLDSETLAQISGLKQLESVEVSGGCAELEDISVFIGLNDLYYLTIGDCSNFSDLSGISRLENLTLFSTINTAVTQLPAEISDTHITNIDLRGCSIADMSPLVDIEELMVIYADEEYAEALQQLFEGRDISICS